MTKRVLRVPRYSLDGRRPPWTFCQKVPSVLQLQADVREQAGEQRGVDASLVGLGGGFPDGHAEPPGGAAQLAVQVLPLADAQVVQELPLHRPPELVARERLLLLAQVAPEVEQSQEVGVLVGEAGVQLVGGLLVLGGTLPRVLDGEPRGDHQHLVEHPAPVGLHHHPRHARVERQRGQRAAGVGQLPVLVEGVQLLEQRQTVGDGAAVRRVDEREVLDRPEVQRGHLQQHRGEVGAQDLRIGELRPALEVGLGVEPDRDARPEPPAPPRPLAGRGLADRLDGQPLHLRAMAVPGDTGGPGVDHVADAGHGERGLRDVGRQHDPPSGVRGEDLVLVGGRQPGVERDDLGVRERPLGERVLGVADLPLAGEEHQDVARPLGHELVDGVEDRADLVAVLVGLRSSGSTTGR